MTASNDSRVYFLDYVKTLIIILIVAHHSSMAYSLASSPYQNLIYSTAQVLDGRKLFIFDFFENFNDIYFMPLMFAISGFFVFRSLKKTGSGGYICRRCVRLIVPFTFSILILMPLSYYPVNLLANKHLTLMQYISREYILNFYHIPGPIWFLLALFVFDCIVAMLYKLFPKKTEKLIASLEKVEKMYFALSFVSVAIIVYYLSYIFLPAENIKEMAKLGPIWFQKKRSLLYFTFFIFGVLGGATTKFHDLITKNNRFLTETWLFRIVISVILFGVFRYMKIPLAKEPDDYLMMFVYVALFVIIAVASISAWLATIAKFMNKSSRVMNSLTEQAYGIFIFHFIIVIWLQYFLYPIDLGAAQKFYIVFSFSLFLSWLVTLILRRIPLVKHIL